MSDFEVLVIVWLSGLTGSALICDVLPRLYRRMNKYERKISKLGEMSDGWGYRWR